MDHGVYTAWQSNARTEGRTERLILSWDASCKRRELEGGSSKSSRATTEDRKTIGYYDGPSLMDQPTMMNTIIVFFINWNYPLFLLLPILCLSQRRTFAVSTCCAPTERRTFATSTDLASSRTATNTTTTAPKSWATWSCGNSGRRRVFPGSTPFRWDDARSVE